MQYAKFQRSVRRSAFLACIGFWVSSAALGFCQILIAEGPAKCGDITKIIAQAPTHRSGLSADSPDGLSDQIFYPAEPGRPRLPFFARLIPLPGLCRPKLQLIRGLISETNAPPVQPVPPRIPRSAEEEPSALAENEISLVGSVYRTDSFWPVSPLSIRLLAQGTQWWARIEFYPHQYNPVRGIIIVNRLLEYEVLWESPN